METLIIAIPTVIVIVVLITVSYLVGKYFWSGSAKKNNKEVGK